MSTAKSIICFFFEHNLPKPREDAIQGLGVAMSTVVSEKNREMLFIGKVFYRQ